MAATETNQSLDFPRFITMSELSEKAQKIVRNEITSQKDYVSGELLIKQLDPNKIKVSAIMYDRFPANPFEDSEFADKLVHRGVYGDRNNEERSEFFRNIGYNEYGEPDFDNDKVRSELLRIVRRRFWVSTTPSERRKIYRAVSYYGVIDKAPNETPREYFFKCLSQVIHQSSLFRLDEYFCDMVFAISKWNLPSSLEDIMMPLLNLFFGQEKVLADEAWSIAVDRGYIGNKNVRLLDIYQHGGTLYSLSGEGIECRFDTSHSAAMWIPNPNTLEYARYHALRELLGVTFVYVRRPKDGATIVGYHTPDSDKVQGLRYGAKTYNELVDKLLRKYKVPLESFEIQRETELTKLAREFLEVYYNYINGSCYMIYSLYINTSDFSWTDEIESGYYGFESAAKDFAALSK